MFHMELGHQVGRDDFNDGLLAERGASGSRAPLAVRFKAMGSS
jgi:hypothetical protein